MTDDAKVGVVSVPGESDVRDRRNSFHRNLEATREKTWMQLIVDRLKVIVPVLIIFIGTLVLMSTVLKDQLVSLFEWAQDNQPESVIYYALFMAVWLVCFLSKSVLSTAGGFVFGFWAGFAGGVVGMLLGLALTILLVKTVFKWFGWKERMKNYLLENYLEIKIVHGLLKTEPFRAILLVKMSLLPTWLKSYSLAILDAPSGLHLLAQFFSGSFYTALYVYLGTAAASILEAVNGSGDGLSWETIVINATGIVMTVLVLYYVKIKMKAAIKKAEEEMLEHEREEEEEKDAEP